MRNLVIALLTAVSVLGAHAQMLRGMGDSTMRGSGATGPSNIALNIAAAALGKTATNLAYDGDMAADLTKAYPGGTPNSRLYSVVVGTADMSWLQVGVNDQRIYGVNATKQGYSQAAQANAIAWLALVNKQTARSVGGESGGTWTDTGIEGIGRRSENVGAIKAFTVSGKTAYVSMLTAISAGSVSNYDIRVDGGSWTSYSGTADGVNTYNGYVYANRLHRIAGLGTGTHVIEVKQTSAGYMYPQWAAGSDQPARPVVLVSDIFRPGPSYSWGGSLANILSYNAATTATIADFVADGADVRQVKLFDALNDTTDLHPADYLHPSDAGYVKIAAAALTAAGGPPPPPPPPTETPCSLVRQSDGKMIAWCGTLGVELKKELP